MSEVPPELVAAAALGSGDGAAGEAAVESMAGAVEIWLADLTQCREPLLALEREAPRLTADDAVFLRSSASRDAAQPRAQTRCAIQVALRLLLERAFGPSARTAPIVRSPAGRPSLEGVSGDFSLSHTADVALIALASVGAIGVDIECQRPIRIAPWRRVLIESASARLAARGAGPWLAPEVPSDDPFLTAWVRLEAYAKARRTSLARLLSVIGALGGAAPATIGELDQRLCRLEGAEPPAALWDLVVPPGLCAASAWTGDGGEGAAACPAVPRRLPPDLEGLAALAAPAAGRVGR